MATFTGSDDLQGSEFLDVNLGGSRFIRSSLSGAVMRGADVDRMDIDAPWLLEGAGFLLVNGVDVAPLVDSELNRRFPGRETRHAKDPEGLREAWASIERTWANTLQRVGAMPDGTVDVKVDGEWSFAETLRHLVMATDKWLRGAVLCVEQPYHPAGQPNIEYETDGLEMSVFSPTAPPYREVLEVRAGRMAMMREYLAAVTAEDLAAHRNNPDDPGCSETVLSCLRVILMEEWEHHRFAVRDLDAIAARSRQKEETDENK